MIGGTGPSGPENIRPGLSRIVSAFSRSGHPEKAFRTLHVAGTNGKGSTACFAYDVLRRLPLGPVGLYTSPHLVAPEERVRIDGASASEEAVLEEVNRMLPALENQKAARVIAGGRANAAGEVPAGFPTFFELMTALAMGLMARQRVDWGVFEVGLGGRLDATNILYPRLTAITSIGLEHTQLLGNTLEKIAREKAGIIKPGTPVLLGPLPSGALGEILKIAAERSAPVLRLDESLVSAAGPGEVRIQCHGDLPAGPVIGPALRTDLGLALTLFRAILASEGRSVETRAIADALSTLCLPARVERFPGTPEIVMDAAHTADSIRALRLTLEEIRYPSPRTVVFSIAGGKDLARILAELPRIASDIIFTLADPIRSVPPASLREELGQGDVIESPRAALDEALRRGNPVVVTGSFYLAGALRPSVRELMGRR